MSEPAAQPEATAYLDRDMTEAELTPIASGQAAVFSSRCPGQGASNEDAAGLIPIGARAAVLVVADGCGGARSGHHAAGLAVQAIAAALAGLDDEPTVVRAAILHGIDQANRVIRDMGVGAATTLAAVEVRDRIIRPYHVGDSMILVVGQRGRVKLQSVSHSPIGFALEAGMLDEQEAMHHEDRHLVSNVIGSADMRVEMGSALRLAPRDSLLLASDGLVDNLHVREVAERLRKGPLHAAARRLADDARQRMAQPVEGLPSKPDDLTFIAYRPVAPSRSSRRGDADGRASNS